MDELINKFMAELNKLNNNLERLVVVLDERKRDVQAKEVSAGDSTEAPTADEKPVEKKKVATKKATNKASTANLITDDAKPGKESEAETESVSVAAKADSEQVQPEEKIEPAPTPAEEPAEMVEQITVDDIREIIKQVMDAKGTAVAKEIINGVGNAPNVSAIATDKYAAVMAACKAAL